MVAIGVLICPQPDQDGNKLQRQKSLMFIYSIYNHNWTNISTIYIYNKTSIKRNILASNKIHREVGRTKYLSALLYPIYNHNWGNITTIYIYNKTSIKRNILTIKKIHREAGQAKDLSASLYSYSLRNNTEERISHNKNRLKWNLLVY